MDIDEESDQAGEKTEECIENATVTEDEIASSSNRRPCHMVEGVSKSKEKVVASSSKGEQNSLDKNEVETKAQEIAEKSTRSEVRDEEQPEQLLQQTNDSTSASVDEEEHQNEQHIENAGIDPTYPLVLVQRVDVPPSEDSSREQELIANAGEDPDAMMEGEPYANELSEINEPSDLIGIFNSISAPGNENEYGDGDEQVMEEEILQNRNFRGISNQLETIRNMISQTRRSMVEAEANFGPMHRDRLLQRLRRVLFILSQRRRRIIRFSLSNPDIVLPDLVLPDVEMEVDNGNSSQNYAQIAESPPTEEANNLTEQEEETDENAVGYDTNLPAEHSYMGDNMNRVSGVNYVEVDQYIKLRLVLHEHVLFPGEVLPFMIDRSTSFIDGNIDEQNGILFGVCFPCLNDNRVTNDEGNSSYDDTNVLLYGVTCQIYELGEDNRGNTLIKSRALQRFVTKANDLSVPLEFINSHPSMKCIGLVKILPDIYLPDPLKCINMGSLNRFRDNNSMQNMFKRVQAATTPWPSHVYETHDIRNLIEKARTQLAQHKIDTMPSDPTQLSYWLVRNLHLPEDMLKSVFLANTVNTRLKLIASTFKKEAIFTCRNCVAHIADCRELFAMSKHGVQSQYCNSAGHIHETNTVYQVNRENILHSGSPSTRFSWFPGYQWHIIICRSCKHHLGWEFKAVEPNLIPKQFFGISSSSVRVCLSEERNTIPAQNAVYINILRLINVGVNELREARNNMPHI